MPRYLERRRAFLRAGLVLTVVCVSLLSGCSKGAGGNSLHIKSAVTGEKDIAVKSGYAFPITKTFTDTTGKMTTAVSYRTYAASYDLDAGNFAMTLDKPLTSDDQMRVVFNLVGDQGGNEKTAPKTGAYSAKSDKFMKVEDVVIVSRKGGADSKVWLDRSTLNGEVKVTAATANSISGDIDLTAGDTVIKGSFAAKVLARK